jgi:hypothetical protein
MRIGFEKEIRRVPASARRGQKVVFAGVGIEVLYSNMLGKLMFLSSVGVNQSKSNQIKPVQKTASSQALVDMVLTCSMMERLGMGHFGPTILV